jgi:DNA-binding response OmpR family regulator
MANILVLDDVLDAGILIKKILEKEGHQVSVFDEEEDAIRHSKTSAPDIAILDIKLIKMTGFEVLEEIKKNRPSIKAIMLTGLPGIDSARKASNLGADLYCSKPMDKNELVKKVQELIKS